MPPHNALESIAIQSKYFWIHWLTRRMVIWRTTYSSSTQFLPHSRRLSLSSFWSLMIKKFGRLAWGISPHYCLIMWIEGGVVPNCMQWIHPTMDPPPPWLYWLVRCPYFRGRLRCIYMKLGLSRASCIYSMEDVLISEVSFKRGSTVHMPTLFVLNKKFSVSLKFCDFSAWTDKGLNIIWTSPPLLSTWCHWCDKISRAFFSILVSTSDQKLEPRKVWEQDCYNLKGGILEVETFNCIRQASRKCETDSLKFAWWSECWQEKNPGLQRQWLPDFIFPTCLIQLNVLNDWRCSEVS